MAVRPGSGKVVKHFKRPEDTMSSVMAEVAELSDTDLMQLAAGIEDGSLTY
jgi:hypothetical protein